MRLFVAVQDRAGDGKPSAMVQSDPLFPFLGHHDIRCIEKWRQRCLLSGQEVRVVGNKTVVLPLNERVDSDEDKLFQTVKKLFQIE